MALQDELTKIQTDTLAQIAAVQDLNGLNDIRVQVLGKKGALTGVLRGMKDLTPEERPKVGSFANT
ncbi:MAG: phenylalanine--tRNA ligase subunit alpha, partial [Schleiferilactobacillus harbinensis]